MGIPYNNEKKLDYKKYNIALKKFQKKNKSKIIFEPGRSIIGNAGVLITKVIYIKETQTKDFIILDAGMNDLLRPALYGAEHRIIPVNKGNKISKKKYEFVGPICETTDKFNEDNKILYPAIKSLRKKGFNISGPFSADTIFLKQNRIKFDVILGMYHDQVLSPMKALMEYDAINITLGLPFLRISPDHGPNEKMINKNLSSPLSLIKAIKFLDKKWLKLKKV